MAESVFIVGAYASLPRSREDQCDYYRLLGSQRWINGAEIPFPGDLADVESRRWLAKVLPTHWHANTITAIPGTMQHVWKDPNFGLASPDADGRMAALMMMGDLHTAFEDFAQRRGSADVAYVEVHTAPTRLSDASAMIMSLEAMTDWDWHGAKLVIEHCDRYVEGREPEKGFLPIESEIELARDTGIGIIINWGRSVVESRVARTAEDHVRAAREAGVLKGLMFSGAGPDETQYGYAWIDGHLPMAPDEPTSLMDVERIRACVCAADDAVDYIGAKVVVPEDATLTERLEFLSHIHDAVVL